MKKFPSHICIDLSNFCNGNCVFCEYPHIKPKRPPMKMELFKKIISECKEHASEIKSIGMPGFSEISLVKNIEEYLSIIRKELPNVYITLTSNGSLKPEQSERIVKNKLADHISFSLDGGTKEAAVTTVGWKIYEYEQIVKNIETFIALKNKYKQKIEVIVNMTASPYNFDSADKFVAKWQKKSDVVAINGIHNGGGNIFPLPDKDLPAEGKPNYCEWIFDNMWIQSDGIVALCCHDAYATHNLGDLNTQSVSEVWNGKHYSNLREIFHKGSWSKTNMCKDCGVISDSFDEFDHINRITDFFHKQAEKNAKKKLPKRIVTKKELADLKALANATSVDYWLYRKHPGYRPLFNFFVALYGSKKAFGRSGFFKFLKKVKRKTLK